MEHRRCFLNRDGETPESACSEDVKELDGRIEGNQCCFVQLLAKQHFHSAVIFFLAKNAWTKFCCAEADRDKGATRWDNQSFAFTKHSPSIQQPRKNWTERPHPCDGMLLFSQQHLQPFMHPGVLGLCWSLLAADGQRFRACSIWVRFPL